MYGCKTSPHSLAGRLTVAGSLLFALFAPTHLALAQTQAVRVTPSVHHDTSIPLRDMVPTLTPAHQEEEELRRIPRPGAVDLPDGAVQKSYAPGRQTLLTAGQNFIGQGVGFPNYSVNVAPPDTNLSVGSNQVVQVVNTTFAVFSKTGATLLAPRSINTLWSGFGGGCQTNNDGDPVAIYDKQANRWVIGQFSVGTTPFLYCIAVSTTSDATGSYNRYSFNYGNINFPDYPKVGVWPDAYYTTYNIFANGQTFTGAESCAFDRAKMLAGLAATQQCFTTSSTFGGLLPADLDGSTPPPAGSPNYQVALGATNTQLAFWKFHVDFTTPANSTFTGPTTITVAGFSPACGGGTCIPQKGTTSQVDSLADRVMYRLSYRNYGSHESLYVNHSVTAGSGVGVRWYELQNPATTPTVFQQATFAPDSKFRWMGSIASDQAGDLALGYSLSSTVDFPTINYTGRLVGDPVNTLQTETTLFVGSGSEINGLSRWGDYSSMSIDPVDDCTFWYTTEYLRATGSFNWSTRIGSFSFPSCGGVQTPDYSVSATPSSVSVTQGAAATYTVTASSIANFSGNVTYTISGLPASTTAAFAPNPVAVPAGSSAPSTLTVSTGNTTPTGSYPLTITGTSGSLTHTASVTLVVTGVQTPDYSVSASPTSVSVAPGGAVNDTVTATSIANFSGNVSYTIAGLPSSTTAAFVPNPAAVPSGGSANSTLTLTTTTATPTGSYPLTVTGTSGSLTHNASLTLVVTQSQSVTLLPASTNFFSYAIGSSSGNRTFTLKNSQTTQLNISSITVSGDFAQTGGTCGPVLAINASCTILVNFTPTAVGTRNGAVTVTDDGVGSPQTAALTGTGLSPTTLNPTSTAFSAQTVGTTSAPRSGGFRNNETHPITITSIVASGDFAYSGGTCPLAPATLAAGKSCSFNMTFTPTQIGPRTGTLTINENAGDGPRTMSLSGTGK